jgi:hypothetical protein
MANKECIQNLIGNDEMKVIIGRPRLRWEYMYIKKNSHLGSGFDLSG